MPKVEAIDQSKLLLVEGRDAYEFFNMLLKHLEISDIQIQNFGGIHELRPFLKVLINAPNFDSVQSIGITRDAEKDASAAFYSVHNSLKAANIDNPSQVWQITTGIPQIGIYLLPDLDAASGMLEDLCLNMLDTDAAIVCVEQYFQCLDNQSIPPPRNFAKAKMMAFLAFISIGFNRITKAKRL